MMDDRKIDSKMTESLIPSLDSNNPLLEEPGQSANQISTFKRIRVAILLFLIPFSLYVTLILIGKIPEVLMHILLTFTVVTAVHLLDRWVLFKDTAESLDKLKEGIKFHVARQMQSMVQASSLITKTSLDEIEAKIAEQTASLVESSASLSAMTHRGIVRLYADRNEACNDIYEDLINPENTRIRIIGISLNDFILADQHTLNKAWVHLVADIRENKLRRDQGTSRDIKVLLIDPECFGAHLRSTGEVRQEPTIPGRLADDVNRVVQYLANLEKDAQKNQQETGVSFSCKLYRLPPILFLCLTDRVCYVQQYYFWQSRQPSTPMPVLRLRKELERGDVNSIHAEMEAHFEWMWENAAIPVSKPKDEALYGMDKGLRQSGVVNVLLDDEEVKTRMQCLLKTAKKSVHILGISLRAFLQPDRGGSSRIQLCRVVRAGEVDVKILLIDPDSEQAQYRSYREFALGSHIGSFDDYKQDRRAHIDSHLSSDTKTSIKEIRKIVQDSEQAGKEKGTQWTSRVQLRQYTSAPVCFMLRVDDTVLVEQYHYGAQIPEDLSGQRTPGLLGKDMPLFEYSKDPAPLYQFMELRSPFELLVSHFEFVFNNAREVDLSVTEH
jgi:hypothetical protein